MQQLQNNSLLQGGKYRIEKVLGQGGFGITYLAMHEMLDQRVCIKEFFFKEFCSRAEGTNTVTLGTEGSRDMVARFQQKFIKEAKTIFKLKHPNIITIHDIFTENGTAYYVMDYIEGESLGEIVKKKGALPESEALNYIRKIGEALSYIHSQGINHLDVKPSNIMCRESDSEVFLIDFGVAKQYDAETAEGTTTTPVGISHGYSPAEQYRQNGVQSFSPQSDVYALAATLFKLLTGNTPPEALDVIEDGIPEEELTQRNISSSTISAIKAAMKSKKQRTQTVKEFIDNLITSVQKETKVQQVGVNNDEETVLIVNTDIINKKEFNVNGIRFCMIKVESGKFRMGAVRDDDAEKNEKPIHTVTLTRTYYIGETVVTNELWEAVMGESATLWDDMKKPKVEIDKAACDEFITKLNELTGEHFRYPTEAEWEFAARGGNHNSNTLYSGSDMLGNVGWYSWNADEPKQVANKKPNDLGIYDMSGNVWEWCEDAFESYTFASVTNPVVNENTLEHVIRGGSFASINNDCRVSARNVQRSTQKSRYVGLRLAL